MIAVKKPYILILCIAISGIICLSKTGFSESQSVNPPSEQAVKSERLITLAPNLTEMVFALDQGSRVIGVSDFDVYPDAVASLPRLGGYLNPDLEQILLLKPDAVLLLEGRARLEQKLDELGLQCWVYKTESYEDIIRSIRDVGFRLDILERAEALVHRIEKQIRSCRPENPSRIKIMVVVGTDAGTLQKIYVAGKGSFLNYLVEQLGAINIFGDVEQAFFEVSTEAIIDRNPDLIIELLPGRTLTKTELVNRKAVWAGFRSITAVQTDHVHVVTEDFLLIPGPRIGDVAEIISRFMEKSDKVKK